MKYLQILITQRNIAEKKNLPLECLSEIIYQRSSLCSMLAWNSKPSSFYQLGIYEKWLEATIGIVMWKELNHSIYHTDRSKQKQFSERTSVWYESCGIELLKDDDAWLKFTFPFPFITCAWGWVHCDHLQTWFMNTELQLKEV